MAVGRVQRQLPVIDPSALIGRADPDVVSPSATAQLIKSFRSGFITAEDIMSRAGELGKTKKKADLMALEEQISPESQAARRAQTESITPRAQLAGAQAKAALPLVQPTADVQAQQLEEMKAVETFGPGVLYFRTLAPEAGLTEYPKTPEGAADYAKRAEIGLKLFSWKANKEKALNTLAKSELREGIDPTTGAKVVMRFNDVEGFITPEKETELRRQVSSPFADVAPGTVAAPTPARAAVAPVTPEQAQAARRELINLGAGEGVMEMPDATVVERARILKGGITGAPPSIVTLSGAPAASTATRPGISLGAEVARPRPGEIIPGVGVSLGGVSALDVKLIPSEGVKQLALAAQARKIVKRLETTYQNLIENNPIFTGLIAGTITKAVAGKRWNDRIAAFEREATAILAPVAKGTYNETGVLSDKDVERYKDVIPDLRDNPSIGQEKIRSLLQETNDSYENVLDHWRRAGYATSGFDDLSPGGVQQQPQSVTTPSAGQIFQHPTRGRLRRLPNGNYEQVQ